MTQPWLQVIWLGPSPQTYISQDFIGGSSCDSEAAVLPWATLTRFEGILHEATTSPTYHVRSAQISQPDHTTMRDTAESTVGSKRAPSPHLPPAKRAKAAQACLSCRKHKTRCEMLDGDSGLQCHRCKVLSLPCSFGDSNGPPVGASTPRPQARVLDAHKADRQPSISLSSNKMQDIISDDSFNPPKTMSTTWEGPAPGTLSLFPDQPREKVEVDLSDPQRLLPERHRPWGLLKLPGGFDGTTVPMLAMQALVRSGVNGEDALKNKIDQSLFQILGGERIKHLTDMYVSRSRL